MYTKHDKVRYSGFIDPIVMALSVMAVIWFFVAGARIEDAGPRRYEVVL